MDKFIRQPQCICPLCGGEVETMIHPTYPPQTHYRCLKCGHHKDVWHKLPEPEIAPFNKGGVE